LQRHHFSQNPGGSKSSLILGKNAQWLEWALEAEAGLAFLLGC
jgi:hypothetical protein